MEAFFIVCFGVGVGYLLLTIVLGELFSVGDSFGVDLEFDMGFLHVKPLIVACFLTIMGATGWLFTGKLSDLFSVSIAVVVGLGGAFVLDKFILAPLLKLSAKEVVEKQRLIGQTATVTVGIVQGGYGKITYHVDGNTYTAPSKSEDGCSIDKYETVRIMYIEKNTFYVTK